MWHGQSQASHSLSRSLVTVDRMSPSSMLVGTESHSVIMATHAASMPSQSSSSSSTAASAASSPPMISYELRDGSNGNASLAAPNIVRLPPSALINELQQAVLADNRGLLPPNYPLTLLDVYPPGSSIEQLSVTIKPAKARDSIASVLSKATGADDDTLVVIARPLPSIAGVQGQLASHHTAIACSCREC
jgi:hypothetical protein